MDNQTEARIREGLSQAQHGNFVPDAEMEDFFARHSDGTEDEHSNAKLYFAGVASIQAMPPLPR